VVPWRQRKTAHDKVFAVRLKIVSTVLASMIALAVAGCGGDGSGSDDAVEPAASRSALAQKLSDPPAMPDGDLTPSPAKDATLSENLAYELRRKTLKMAAAPGDITAKCPAGLQANSGTKVTCTATYNELAVEWNVTIGEKSEISDSLVEFEAVPNQGILTRDGVARVLYGNFRDSIDYALCNDIPDAVLVPLDAKTKYVCEVVFKGKQPTGNGEAVRLTDSGPRVY
jgi:hypothetical protein